MPSQHKTRITWLHLSDLHFRESQSWSQDVVLDSLIKDIRDRYTEAEKPDLLFITGDIAFSGKPEEYKLAEDFIRLLLQITSVPPDRLFFVPGNHDIDRDVEEDAFRGARNILTNPIEVDKFFAKEPRRRTLFKRQEAFRAFANKFAPSGRPLYTESSYAHSRTVLFGPITIRAILLDSAWLSEGDYSDIGLVLVGERQVIDACGEPEIHALTFGLIHHPFAWLRDFEQTTIETLLLDRLHILLRGHVHTVDIRSIEMLNRRLNLFTAGAAYENRTSNNCYGWACIDLSTGMGESITHNYVHLTKRWEASIKQPWRLLTNPNPNLPIAEVIEFFHNSRGNYQYYQALLVTGHQTEIPRYVNGRYVYMNHTVEIENDRCPIKEIISKIRYLFFWKKAWAVKEWQSELEFLMKEFRKLLNGLSAASREVADFLSQQEAKCRSTATAFLGTPLSSISHLQAHLADLKTAGNWELVLETMARWRSASLLNKEEEAAFLRLEVHALLELGQIPDAIAKVEATLSNKTPDASHYYWAAGVYYTAKEYVTAGRYMHKALDSGIDTSEARELTLLIAGKTGDRALSQRVIRP